MNPKLEMIAEEAASRLKTLFSEASDDIQRGIEVTVLDAQDNELEAKFTLSFQIQLNLDRNSVTHRLGFSTRHKYESVTEMPNPDQANLPLEVSND